VDFIARGMKLTQNKTYVLRPTFVLSLEALRKIVTRPTSSSHSGRRFYGRHFPARLSVSHETIMTFDPEEKYSD
jgi:hypothetical protein